MIDIRKAEPDRDLCSQRVRTMAWWWTRQVKNRFLPGDEWRVTQADA